MSEADEALAEQAHLFAKRLSDSVSGFLGRACPMVAEWRGTHLVVSEEGGEGVSLTVRGIPMLALELTYKCVWDESNTFLAIETSRVAVFAGSRPKGNPLFRYEYERGLGRDIPSAHLQVHAHRDAFAHVMSTAGRKSTEGTLAAERQLGEVPELSAFHFPQGGHRFRPCLEDILASLKVEFGLDSAPNWREVLNAGRMDWRRRQVAAAVMDSPDVAVQTLRAMGYQVSCPQDAPPERVERLASL